MMSEQEDQAISNSLKKKKDFVAKGLCFVVETWLELLLRLLFHASTRGTFDIYVKCDGVGRCVGNYDNRGSFGELALMYNTPRAATITATSPGALWGLVSEMFIWPECCL